MFIKGAEDSSDEIENFEQLDLADFVSILFIDSDKLAIELFALTFNNVELCQESIYIFVINKMIHLFLYNLFRTCIAVVFKSKKTLKLKFGNELKL